MSTILDLIGNYVTTLLPTGFLKYRSFDRTGNAPELHDFLASLVGCGYVIYATAPGNTQFRGVYGQQITCPHGRYIAYHVVLTTIVWLRLLQAKAKALSANIIVTPPWQMPNPLQ